MRAFTDTLKDIREGAVLTELAEHMAGLLDAVRATGKGGKLTLSISVKPLDGTANQVLISDDIKTVVPEPNRPTTVMFVTEENELTRRDPRQPKLPEMGVVRSMPVERAEGQ